MPMMIRPLLRRRPHLSAALVMLLAGHTQSVAAYEPLTPNDYTITVVADSLDHPWSLAFLPDGRLLVTERAGQLRIVDKGKVSAPVTGVPAVFAKSQGGLFDVVLHPDFETNGWLYLSYAYGTDDANATRLARARLVDNSLVDVTVLFTATPFRDTPVHFGGRMAFLPDKTLLLAIGDGFDYREQAQRNDSHLGTFVRLNDDGSVPADNPFVDDVKVLPEIWSYGHRNPQAIVVHPDTGKVLSHEHGPAGGDEVNRMEPGLNYGWPIATYGDDYSGAAISPFTHYPGTEQPLLHWTPSIAPAGMAIGHGDAFPALQGDWLVAALKAREVRRVHINEDQSLTQQSLLTELGKRLRDIRVASDGTLYILTDSSEGKVLHVTPNP
ncbi:Soluble aldose sugar dehydrogenase YliI [Granulosicoccus antarcticus IMCC3135]|uniref:Soluble aldose sugar dehydrogenase YliI n=2 Tax=Granulosicoccus TaxID=437504 RepID=A0A2Z2NHD6_9GAMM|nr:Soluble aldose sugar dehydrogenase YliI [Granulosicoccus antarcticus IMCC3135]